MGVLMNGQCMVRIIRTVTLLPLYQKDIISTVTYSEMCYILHSTWRPSIPIICRPLIAYRVTTVYDVLFTVAKLAVVSFLIAKLFCNYCVLLSSDWQKRVSRLNLCREG